MIEDQYLAYFINEDIYQVEEKASYDQMKPDEAPTKVEEPVPEQPVAAPPTKEDIPDTETVHELAIWTPPLTNQDRELLTKILKAINKDFSEAYLMEGINTYKPQFKTLLCFGYQKELELKAGKAVQLYQPATIEGRTFLTSVSPAELQEDKKQKALLWEALQKMFL